MGNYFEEFTIPYFQTKVNDWEQKKLMLTNLYLIYKSNMTDFNDQQINDYKKSNKYQHQVESILMDDIINAGKSMNIEFTHIRVNNSWFQRYKQFQYHSIHNHGIGGFSSVCFIEYDKDEHKPTTFISPFNNWIDNSLIEFTPKNIEEGSIVFFPSNIVHYVEPNKSLKDRLILSFNFSFN